MEWVERMNKAISYIEDHITGNIDYKIASKITCCSCTISSECSHILQMFQISIKGGAEMNYRIERLKGFSIVGLQERVNTNHAFNIIPDLWANAAEEGLFERLWKIRADHQMRGILGVCADGDFGNNEEFNYIMSMVSEQEPEPPEEMIKRDFPEVTWAFFEAEGGPESIYGNACIRSGSQPLVMILIICLLLSVICPQKRIKMSYGWQLSKNSLYDTFMARTNVPIMRRKINRRAICKGINSLHSDVFIYKIMDTSSHEMIGSLQLCRSDMEKNEAVIGRFIIGDLHHRGSGIGTIALKEIVQIGFNQFNLNRIRLNVFDINSAAICCYERVGFKLGKLTNNVYTSSKGEQWGIF